MSGEDVKKSVPHTLNFENYDSNKCYTSQSQVGALYQATFNFKVAILLMQPYSEYNVQFPEFQIQVGIKYPATTHFLKLKSRGLSYFGNISL